MKKQLQRTIKKPIIKMEKFGDTTDNNPHEYPANENDDFNVSFPPSQSDLIANILMERWSYVISILSSTSFAQQVQTQTFSDPTPLHVACSFSSVPLKVVKSILDVYGDSCCLIEDNDGNLPIHVACSTPHLDHKVIELLLGIAPETSE